MEKLNKYQLSLLDQILSEIIKRSRTIEQICFGFAKEDWIELPGILKLIEELEEE